MVKSIYINKKSNELHNLYNLLNAIEYDIQHTETPTDGLEEMRLDDLYLELDRIKENIIKLKTFLHVVKETNKYKMELLDKKILI
jgi:hypothetical protein